jgi:hypothetical protein
MANEPSAGPARNKEAKQPKARKRTILISLLVIELAIASTILTLGVRKFSTWYHDTRPKKRQNDVLFYTILLIATCTPTCVFAGMLVAAAYYYKKKRRWGEYKINMRRQGRGFVMDPTDAEDKKKENEAKKINAAIAQKAKEENEKGKIKDGDTMRFSEQSTLVPVSESERMNMVASWASGASTGMVTQPEPAKAKDKYSSVNPYGWHPETERSKACEEPKRFVGRSDSWKAYRDSPVSRKGVDNIWLRGSGNRASDGKGKGKSSWDDDVEMGVVRKGTM